MRGISKGNLTCLPTDVILLAEFETGGIDEESFDY